MSKVHFGGCPVCVIDDLIAVVVISSGAIRLECVGCWNQFNSPVEARHETLEPLGRDELRPATQTEVSKTGWRRAD